MDELLDKVLSARVTVLTASPEPRLKIPPPDAAVLSDRVPLVTVSVLPPRFKTPPPLKTAEFISIVVLANVAIPPSSLSIPPPYSVAELLEILEPVTVNVPSL